MAVPTTAEPAEGLTSAEAAARLAAQGVNALPAAGEERRWRLLVDVVTEPMFLLLAACGAIYLLLGDRGEALMLLGFVVIVVGMTYAQKRRTERSLAALRSMASPRALVLRDGRPQRIAAQGLVEGDLVLLAEGDRVPADLVLLAASNLAFDESMLTGESVPVSRSAGATVHAGTLVTGGTGRGRVAATGARSAIGRIGASMAAIAPQATPIQRQTRQVVRQVATGGLLLATLLCLLYGWLQGDWLRGLLAGLTLAMAVLPEELPVVLTLFLSIAAWRLVRRQVLARSMPAIEQLGATTVLCVDKTGTLTVNRMALAQLWSERSGAMVPGASMPADLRALLEHAVLASHRTAFDPMEAALGAAGDQWGAAAPASWQPLRDYPVAPTLLVMSRAWRAPGRLAAVAAKGAPEAVVALCGLAPARAAAVTAQVAALAQQGLRVLGVACATADAAALPAVQTGFDFTFLGLVALADPLRPEVPAVVAQCHAAGVRVVMITGDHPATAIAIARQAGIATGAAAAACLNGPELDRLDAAQLAARLAATSVFCRIAPQQKLRLVRAFQAGGATVAMTGDGVNDAPALKAADIGVAMGARGTDVAREAAALVLLGEDFGALLAAVGEGRRLFANLRKALVFIVAIHVPIVGLSVLPVLWHGPMLLMPAHILFLQLIIDPACSVIFAAEPLEPGAMRQPPRSPSMQLFDHAVLRCGLLQGGGLLGLLTGMYLWLQDAADMARTAVFVTLVLANLGLIFSNRRWRAAEVRPTARRNRYLAVGSLLAAAVLALVLGVASLRSLFAFVPLDLPTVAVCMVTAVLGVAWFELVKLVAGRGLGGPGL